MSHAKRNFSNSDALESQVLIPDAQALRSSEQRYRALANATSSIIWHTDANGNFLTGESNWLEYTGQSATEVKGAGWLDAFHTSDRQQISFLWQKSLADTILFSAKGRLWYAGNHRYRHVLIYGVPVANNEGILEEWIGTCVDVTARHLLEEQRHESLRREQALRTVAEAANRALEKANRTKDEFLATLSHELRTPLTAILGWTQVLQRSTLDASILQRAITAIAESAQAQTSLVEDLLNISDIVVGKLRLNIQSMVLVEAIKAALEAVRPAIDNKHIRLLMDLPDATRSISGDPTRIQQIVWNLVSNAVKFTPIGGLIRISCENTAHHARITVADSGEGIANEFLPFVFDRFRQADSSSKRPHGGLGLGLAIVRYLTELHGGTVSADSAGLGRGASFNVLLPLTAESISLSPEQNPKSSPAIDMDNEPEIMSLQGICVLSVDDDRNTREMLEEALKSFGARVFSASCSKEALQMVQDVLPNVLISDIGMAEEDGYDLIRQIRQLNAERGGLIPAIALTGYARPQDKGLAQTAGFNAYLSKPVNLNRLITTIVELAGKK